MNGRCAAAESRVRPVAPPQDHVIEHARIVKKRVAAYGDRANTLLNQPAQTVAHFSGFSLAPARQVFSFRKIEEPLRRLYPGHVWIAKIAQRMAEQGGKYPGVGVADNNKIAVGLLKAVAQVAGLKADVGLASDIVNAFLFANGFHLRAAAVIKHVDAVVNRERVRHLQGIANGQPDQLGVFRVGGNEQIHLDGTGLYGLLRRQAFVNFAGRRTLRRILFFPQIDGKQHGANPRQGFGEDQRNGIP